MIVAADTNSMTGAMKALDAIALSPLNLPWRGRGLMEFDYNLICASIGGHLSFHGAAAS
jgi:hypothetical protein